MLGEIAERFRLIDCLQALDQIHAVLTESSENTGNLDSDRAEFGKAATFTRWLRSAVDAAICRAEHLSMPVGVLTCKAAARGARPEFPGRILGAPSGRAVVEGLLRYAISGMRDSRSDDGIEICAQLQQLYEWSRAGA